VKSDLEVELTRVFNAPRSLVFEAHSKPEHVRRWWGPRDTTIISCDMDFRPGGDVSLRSRTERADSLEARDGMLQSGMATGAAETYDRLEEHLCTLA